jgi:hypothetical protein
MNTPTAVAKRGKSRRYLARVLAMAGIAAVIAVTGYLHAWALHRDMTDVASFVTALGCLTLAGLAVLAAMLHHWTWSFALASLCLALLILFSVTALLY